MSSSLSGIGSFGVSASLLLNPVAAEIKERPVAMVANIYSLLEVKISQPEKTVFLFDLDDTAFDFPYMLGSRGWRSYIGQAAKKIDDSRNWHDVLSYFLAKNYRVETVEPITGEFIKKLQEKGYIVCGFTSRQRELWYNTLQEGVDVTTINQLDAVNIHFSDASLKETYPYLGLAPEYFNGTFFCDIEKGEFLTRLLKNVPELPEKVVFVDDKRSLAESVAKALTALGISQESYCYLATEAKAKSFNPLIANIQLYHFLKSKEILSDADAQKIAEKDLSNDADFYLKASLEIANEKDSSLLEDVK